MKKKKSYKKKTSRKKTNKSLKTARVKQQTKTGEAGGGKEKEDLVSPPTKKGIDKKAEPRKTEKKEFLLKRYFDISRQFLVDTKIELKKVTWPTKKELFSTTAIVVILVILAAFFLGIVDLGLVKIIKNVIG